MSTLRTPPGKLSLPIPQTDDRDEALSPNAKSIEISVAPGASTYGLVNQHPSEITEGSFRVGVSEDRNKKCRRTMEDAHAFVYDFGGIKGQGYFAIFDGHAGKHAAEWCGAHFHEYLLKELEKESTLPVPDLLNRTFHVVDAELSRQAHEDNTHSGCTAVTAFLRLEDAEGRPVGDPALLQPAPNSSPSQGRKTQAAEDVQCAKRTLYTANVGDARAVLCRNGEAVRLTYDHKGSDAQEARRIMDAGGFVMNNRVNGVLAVTRSLGDSSMKEFVVGSPYTTETTLTESDEFLIIACDGLWDVCEDQKAVDLIRDKVKDPQEASKILLEHALSNFSTDNLSVLVVAL